MVKTFYLSICGKLSISLNIVKTLYLSLNMVKTLYLSQYVENFLSLPIWGKLSLYQNIGKLSMSPNMGKTLDHFTQFLPLPKASVSFSDFVTIVGRFPENQFRIYGRVVWHKREEL